MSLWDYFKSKLAHGNGKIENPEDPEILRYYTPFLFFRQLYQLPSYHELRVLEGNYEKYNGGRGLAALNKAEKKLDEYIDEINIKLDDICNKIKNEERLNEILDCDIRRPLNERFAVNRNDERVNIGEKKVMLEKEQR